MIHIKTNETLKDFFKFLKENNAYLQYRENIVLQSRRTYNDIILFFYGVQFKILKNRNKEEITEDTAKNLINFAFHWDSTKQRHLYWEELHEKWKDYFYENIKNYYEKK